MITRALAVTGALLAASGVVHADDAGTVLVLRAEGRADKKLRTKIEAAVARLAAGTGATPRATTPGDVTFGDAAAMVGCKPDEDKCKDEVLGMLSVDELVAITATPKPGGIEVQVRRIVKGGVTKTAQVIVTADKADQLEALAPVFAPEPAATPTPAPLPSTATTTPPSTSTSTPSEPAPLPTGADGTVSPAVPFSDTHDDGGSSNRRLMKFGMAGGGALFVIGVVFWASAASVEDEIADAPVRTRDDLEHIKDLEAEGDGYATVGNVLVLSGLVLGGVSAYYYWKSGKQPTRTARVVPLYGNGGGGVALTWGGSL